jgi:hypothetical protein
LKILCFQGFSISLQNALGEANRIRRLHFHQMRYLPQKCLPHRFAES